MHKNFDYERLAETLKSCQHKWLLTLDDCEFIRNLFDFAEIKPLKFSYGMRNVRQKSNQTGNELIIKNF